MRHLRFITSIFAMVCSVCASSQVQAAVTDRPSDLLVPSKSSLSPQLRTIDTKMYMSALTAERIPCRSVYVGLPLGLQGQTICQSDYVVSDNRTQLYFSTQPPGSTLPDDQACADAVRPTQ